MSILNQNSFIILSLLGFLILASILLRDGIKTNDIMILAALAIGVAIAFLLFRPGESSSEEADQVLSRIGAGQPVLLEFQSNF